MNSSSHPLAQFALLSADEQQAAVRRLAAQGWSDYGISAATKLSVEQIRRLLSERGHHGEVRS